MIDRQTITACPLCGSTDIEHVSREHTNPIRGTAHNVPQTICHHCGEIFLGADSLEVMRSQEVRPKRPHRSRKPAKAAYA